MCLDAWALNILPATFKGTTKGATPDFEEHDTDLTCGVDWYTRGVWYKLQGRGSVIRLEYQLLIKGNQGNSELSLFTGSSCDTMECAETIEGKDHSSSYEADLYNEQVVHEFHAAEGETYWFRLSGETFDTAADYEFQVTEHQASPPST